MTEAWLCLYRYKFKPDEVRIFSSHPAVSEGMKIFPIATINLESFATAKKHLEQWWLNQSSEEQRMYLFCAEKFYPEWKPVPARIRPVQVMDMWQRSKGYR